MAEDRLITLDVIRGIAVMGILVANLPAFGLPESAYFSPRAWGGDGTADVAAWFATLVLVEGKMRGLFSMLFGASTLLVIDRAAAGGDSAGATHLRRMAVLFVLGCVHLYLIWWGDILAHYALVGAIAYLFTRLSARWLLVVGLAMVALSIVNAGMGALAFFASAPRATAEQVATWNGFAGAFGAPRAADVAAEIAAFRGGWTSGVAWRWTHAADPFGFLLVVGVETLSAMLIGMAAYRSGFLTGAWPRARYARWAAACLVPAWLGYAALGVLVMARGFSPPWVFLASIVLSAPLRVLGYVGYAALIMVLAQPGGWWTRRIAAVGRAAFTNYLGTSILMALVFEGWGLGLFAALGRAQLYVLAPIIWVLMLAWSLPWLSRYRYGPLEWVWRSLARFARQPMRGAANATS